ncbi:MAG: siroheme decarboxylase subunit beta [Promethearchaeota archaeon]
MISDEELAVLSEVQRLPFVPEPFAEIANRLGRKEEEVINICKDLLDRGLIRRFGISIDHKKVGINANLMVVANVTEELVDEIGEKIAEIEGVTHCYHRVGWDYNLFFMIHSDSKEEVAIRAKQIMDDLGITEYKHMFSKREFKKISFEIVKAQHEDYEKLIESTFQLPIVLNLSGPVIIFGGGLVGKRKVDFLSNFTKDITVISKDSLDLPEHVKLHLINLDTEDYTKYIPEFTSLVVAALSDSQLNAKISDYCRVHNILVNVVDNVALSSVIFPALSKNGDLNIAVSTGGKCPFLSKKFREYLDSINDPWADWLDLLSPFRKNLVGIEEKNRILSNIYNNSEVKSHILNKEIKLAKIKAMEIYNVSSKH